MLEWTREVISTLYHPRLPLQRWAVRMQQRGIMKTRQALVMLFHLTTCILWFGFYTLALQAKPTETAVISYSMAYQKFHKNSLTTF